MMPKNVVDLLACWTGIWGNNCQSVEDGALCSSCGVFGMRGMENVLITKNTLRGSSFNDLYASLLFVGGN